MKRILTKYMMKHTIITRISSYLLNGRIKYTAHGGVVDEDDEINDNESYMTNTLEALLRAMNEGLPCVEVDASMTSDGRVVALHTRELKKMMQRSGHLEFDTAPVSVEKHHFRSLQLLDAGGGAKIPTLDTVLAKLCNNIDTIIIDLKPSVVQQEDDEERRSFAEKVVHIVNTQCSSRRRTRIIFFTKDDAIVPDITQYQFQHHYFGGDADGLQGMETGYVVMNGTAQNIIDGHHRLVHGRPVEASVAAVFSGMVDTNVVHELHASDKQVFTWVVDDSHRAIEMMELDVDGIVSNKPAHIVQAMDSYRKLLCD